MTDIYRDIVDYLDATRNAVPMSVMLEELPAYTVDELKAATKVLFDERRINRVSIRGTNYRFFYAFFSLYVHTVGGHESQYDQNHALAPAPEPERELIVATAVPAEPVVVEPVTVVAAPVLSPDEAVEVLRRGGWEAEPEVVVKPVERRVARLTAMEVIDRWKLPYRLSRVIEIIGGTRKGRMTRDDAANVIALVRQHAKGDDHGVQ